jgi:hypothetical protein
MIEFIKTDIIDDIFHPGVFFTYMDTGVSKELYEFLDSKLDDYNLLLDGKCWMSSETDYDEKLELLIMGIKITVPKENITEKNINEIPERILIHKSEFPKFYEKQKELFNHINRNKPLKR